MKAFFLNTAAVLSISVVLAACGGGGGGASSPSTQGATTVFLFGTMSSTSKVATLQSEIIVPDGIMVNYSSPPGVLSGRYPLRSGSIVPSGPEKVPMADVTAEYNLADRKLSIYYLNAPDFSTLTRKNIKSGTSGNGVEIATLNFKLTTAGALPIIPTPWQDSAVSVYEETSSSSVLPATGLKLNFVTTFQP